MNYGPDPWLQTSWDWRAAANFMAGGAGCGLLLAASVAGGPRWLYAAGAALVCAGLLAVLAKIGRPWRALNVFAHPGRSWMSREALVAPPLLVAALAASFGVSGAAPLAGALALGFVYCQGRILQAARGIPAWRSPVTTPLIVAIALAEGVALWLLLSGRSAGLGVWAGFALALAASIMLHQLWRNSLGAAPRARVAAERAGRPVVAALLFSLAAVVPVVLAPLPEDIGFALQWLAGAVALAGGAWLKFTLVTRTGFNQGYALAHVPVRGAGREGSAR